MPPIEHSIAAIEQKTSECMQTAAAQMLSFFDPSISVDEVIQSVPVYEENGVKIGTSPGHLAAYLAAKGYSTMAYVFDVELFDRSWQDFAPQKVLASLRERERYIPSSSYLAQYHKVLVDGWDQFVQAGGLFSFSALSIKLLRELLDVGPYMLLVNATYLNQEAKRLYDERTNTLKLDALRGKSVTHAVTCAGYKSGRFLLVDPDPPKGGEHHRWVAADHLIASIMAAQTESDNMLITIGG